MFPVGSGRRVLLLLLSLSYVTRKKTARKKWPRDILEMRSARKAAAGGLLFLSRHTRRTIENLKGTSRGLRGPVIRCLVTSLNSKIKMWNINLQRCLGGRLDHVSSRIFGLES